MRLICAPWALGRPSVAACTVAAAVAVGGVGTALSLAGVRSVATGWLTLVFLGVAPGAAVSGLVGGDRFGRIVAAIAGAIAVNGAVAQAMLVLGAWSPPGGVAAVALISALCVALRPLVRRGSAAPTEM